MYLSETRLLNPISPLHEFLRIGAEFYKEQDISQLLEDILQAAMRITNADAGSLYLVQENLTLTYEIVHTNSREVHRGGKSNTPIDTSPIPLFLMNGEPDLSKVSCYAYHRAETVNISNVYNATGFDFNGTRQIDAKNGYRSESFLTVPMKNHEYEVIGVLQLINAIDADTATHIPFSKFHEEIVEALASHAAIALTNRNLIDRLEKLFVSFISLINQAIDDKSPHTGGHCDRVPDLTLMLADAVDRCKFGPLKAFSLTQEDRYELKIAGLLHDCGKITTPVHVVDKATKLEKIFDRIELIETRAEIIFRDIRIAEATHLISAHSAKEKREQLIVDYNFLSHCNIGVESMKNEDIDRIHQIAKRYLWEDISGKIHPFLTDEEILNLTIRAGTLNSDERAIINQHIESTIKMLDQLPWPKHLKNVPEYAGGHHERMDGKGYPKGLKRDELSIQARCMGIADIFEALTAKDRPYKKGNTLSEAIYILGKMKVNQHIDPDLFDIFIWEKVYVEYAEKFLDEEQIDDINLSIIPGYAPPPHGISRN